MTRSILSAAAVLGLLTAPAIASAAPTAAPTKASVKQTSSRKVMKRHQVAARHQAKTKSTARKG